ncbi:MAG: hypothetical protein B7733_12305 [Myxococcales bacterium FL481]|nr:MAG: hypothetical protein B7733_12305 [Myxococcales bacterium FL481]
MSSSNSPQRSTGRAPTLPHPRGLAAADLDAPAPAVPPTGPPPPPAAPGPVAMRTLGFDEAQALGAGPHASSANASADLDLEAAALSAETIEVPANDRPTDDFQQHRAEHAGTRMAGLDGLAEPSAEQPRLRLTVGRVIPGTRYRIIRWLGEGGMGVVYEAEHVDIERRVALKILRFDLSQEERMAQVFRDEARAASRVGSTNIVEIYDFGELADGRLFFCMELLAGGDLIPASEDDWTPIDQLIPTLRQICKGLHAAHQAGIIHRDIKPENVIVVDRDGRRGAVKIVDFGISAMLAAGGQTEGSVAGTPHYMAPEQITGKPFDGRLDIYALGCLAYELLVGYPPFLCDNVEQLLRLQLAAKPKPPRRARPDREIPEAIEAVVMRCLAKDPAQRFADMADLEAALCEAQIAAGITTAWDDLALPPVDDERRERLLRDMPSPHVDLAPRRRRLLWPSVAGAATLAAIGALYTAMTAKPDPFVLSRVEVLTTDANRAAARNHHVFPPTDHPDTRTAYQAVLELEDLGDEGTTRGHELRGSFSTALREVGAKWWDVGTPETQKFAREYYWQSLLFDHADPVARDRAGFSPGLFGAFAESAERGEFSATQLAWGEVLNALAEQDEAKREENVAALSAEVMREATVVGSNPLVVAHNAGLIRQAPSFVVPVPPPPVPVPEGLGGEFAGGDAAPPDDDDREFEEIMAADSSAAAARPDARKRRTTREPRLTKLASARRDPAQAKTLASQGQTALARGQRRKAEDLFHRAVGFDRRNAAALMGLSDVYFDTGSKGKAVQYAERAVAVAGKNKTYRLKLGDAYFLVLRYRDALTQYEKAHEMGLARAAGRIKRVKAKIGE